MKKNNRLLITINTLDFPKGYGTVYFKGYDCQKVQWKCYKN